MTNFWEIKNLNELSDIEWEALCDGCGRCCLQKLQCEDTEEVFYTNLACELLDLDTCQCSDYSNRTQRIATCINLKDLSDANWNFMPDTCAYRLVHEGKALFNWHPLIAGNQQAMIEQGISVKGKVLPDKSVAEQDYEEHIVTWVGC